MKKIYLHIGTEKTGSSAIQNTLQNLQNRRLLKRHDFALLSGRLYSLLMAAWHVPTKRKERTEKHSLDRVVAYLQDFLQKTPQKHIIITCEAFATATFLENDNVRALATALQAYDVQVFLYLRRQDHYAESNWAQKTKNFITSDVFIPERPSWKTLLDTYATFFGKECVHMRVYERTRLYMQDVVCDFLQWVGLQCLIPQRKKVNGNLSLSPANLRVRLSYIRQNKYTQQAQRARLKVLTAQAAQYQADLPWHIFQELQAVRHGINADTAFLKTLNTLLLLEKTPQKNPHTYMSFEARKKYLAQFTEENVAIAKEYLQSEHETLFDDTLPHDTTSLGSPDTDDIVTVFLPIFVHLAEKIENLERAHTQNVQKVEQLR